MNPGMMYSRRHADVVDIGLFFEIEMHPLYIFDFKVAFPKGGRIDAVSENRAIPNFGANASQALDGKSQSVFIRPAPTIVSPIIERREELPGQIPVCQVQFDPIQPGADRSSRGFRKGL